MCSRALILLHGKCRNAEFFWSVFSRIWTEYGEMWIDIQSEYGKIRSRKNSILDTFHAVYIPIITF